MNDKDNTSPDKDEYDLEDALARMKRVEPPLEARIINRQVIATELARIEQRRMPVPQRWWRQSFSVPVPVALGVCILLLVSLVVNWPRSGNIPGRTEESAGADPIAKPSEKNELEAPPRLTYSASEIYLCGIGRLSYESRYHFQEEYE